MDVKQQPLITRNYLGIATVAGLPIRLADLARAHDDKGLSIDELAERIPILTRDQIREAVDYYRKHGDPCEANIRKQQQAKMQKWLAEKFAEKGNWLPTIAGKWPGDESDEEIAALLEELS
jgi:uncharacterized protein (DUF433 family)